jgi:VWFA-related protein
VSRAIRVRQEVKRRAVWKIATPLSFCLICAAFAVAQQSSETQSPASDAGIQPLRISSQVVLLDAVVENRKTGNPIEGLEANDFAVAEDGKPQRIIYFSHDQLPLSVVFLFDLTDTVRPVLKPLAQAAQEMLGHLKPGDQVSIMVFSSHTELLQDFTADRSLAAAAVERASRMKTSEGTFIHEDMNEAIQQALKSTVPDCRRVMVWLTDGTANFENSFTRQAIGKQAPAHLHTKKEATVKLMASGVVVAALIERSALTDAVVTAADVSPFSFLYGGRIGDISNYAEITGGPVLNSGRKDVAERLSKLIDDLRGRYTLGYEPLNPRRAGSFCKLRVTLLDAAYQAHGGLRKSDVVVLSKRGYYR